MMTNMLPAQIDDALARCERRLAGQSLLDEKCVAVMRRLKLAERLYPAFIAELPEKLAALRSAMEIGDRPAIRLLAHRLRGGAAQLGAAAFARMLREIEEAAIRDEGAKAHMPWDPGLEDLARATVIALQRELASSPR